MTLRAFSYGGGWQSTAALVLAVEQRIDFPLFLFSNVGEDSEHPDTLRYVREIAMPYAAANGIELVELVKRNRAGDPITLLGKLTREGSQSTSIPYRSRRNGPPMSRSCTAEFKIRVLGKELRSRGATAGRACKAHRDEGIVSDCPKCVAPNLAVVGVGISLDESHRANTSRGEPHERVVYPLIGIGEETGLKLNRADCAEVIRRAGIPVPPKSSCWFCPHHKTSAWKDLRRDSPDLFDRAADLEEHLDTRNVAAGKGHVFLSGAGIPLRDAIDSGDVPLFEGDDGCDTGFCFT